MCQRLGLNFRSSPGLCYDTGEDLTPLLNRSPDDCLKS